MGSKHNLMLSLIAEFRELELSLAKLTTTSKTRLSLVSAMRMMSMMTTESALESVIHWNPSTSLVSESKPAQTSC